MFDSLWNFIHNLFLSIMSDNGPVPRTIYSGLQLIPSRFYDMVCDVPITDRPVFVVTEIRWYKQRTSLEHEYLLARLQRRGSSQAMFATIERGPSTSANQFQVSSTSSPSFLSKEVYAYDLITCLSKDDMQRRITGDNLLATCTFTGLRLVEFSRLVHIVSQHETNYQVNTTMCYWFAAAIMEVAKSRFSRPRTDNSPVPAYSPLEGRGVTQQKYEDDKFVDPFPIGPERERAIQREDEAREEGLQRGLQQGKRERAALLAEMAKRDQEAADRAQKLIEEAANATEAFRALQAQLRRGGGTGAMNATDHSPRKHIRPTGE
ncbi:hypothetical protein JB92DRAFT_3149511 [Gautieria morchelliformis]|nr:hypothetical protein JB92DRAFT_3149511 [Gautieria morchelliformis]